jgi:transcriptional regulator with XRE-family HTH domain
MALKSAQSRGARGWLGWNQDELAKKAGVGLSTLRDFEGDRRSPIPNNLAAIRRALEDGGASDFLAATDALAAPASAVSQSPESPPGKHPGNAAAAKRGKRSPR